MQGGFLYANAWNNGRIKNIYKQGEEILKTLVIIFVVLIAIMGGYLLALLIQKMLWKTVYKSFVRVSNERYNGYTKYQAKGLSANSKLYKAKKLYIAFEDDKIVLLRNEGSNQKYACEFNSKNIKAISCSSYGMNIFIEIKHTIAGLVSPYKVEIFSNHSEDIEDAVDRMAARIY